MPLQYTHVTKPHAVFLWKLCILLILIILLPSVELHLVRYYVICVFYLLLLGGFSLPALAEVRTFSEYLFIPTLQQFLIQIIASEDGSATSFADSCRRNFVTRPFPPLEDSHAPLKTPWLSLPTTKMLYDGSKFAFSSQ